MNVNIPITYNEKISKNLKHKLLFINNALDNGWEIKKKENKYFFTKKLDEKSNVYDDDYLYNFIQKNCNNKII